jgi:hypothetical protein
MAVFFAKGTASIETRPKAASTVFAANTFVSNNGSGKLIPSTSSSTLITGVVQQAVASTDSNYASATDELMVIMPSDRSIFEADITTGTLTAAMVGNSYGLTNATGVDVTNTTTTVVTCVGFISGTKGYFKINSRESVKNEV